MAGDLTLQNASAFFKLDDTDVSAPLVIKQAQISTTDATQTSVATIAVAEDELVTIWCMISAFQDDGSESYSAIKAGSFSRDAGGNVAIVGSVTDVHEAEDSDGAPDFTMQADTTAQTVDLDFTGVAATNYAVKLTYIYMKQGVA